jgi:hypothetical protein
MTMMNYRQGDVPLVPYSGSFAGLEPIEPTAGKLILALGEATGHHHRIEGCSFSFEADDNHRMFRDPMTGAQVLQIGASGASLVHEEHDPIELPPGNYLQLVQVEDDGEMISQVVD